jgi:hypothetical protein
MSQQNQREEGKDFNDSSNLWSSLLIVFLFNLWVSSWKYDSGP